jgi:hypothetical protein
VVVPATGAVEPEQPDEPADPEKPVSPETGDNVIPVVIALLTLIASGVAVSVLKKRA